MRAGERCVGDVTILDITGPLTDDDDINILLRDTLARLIQAFETFDRETEAVASFAMAPPPQTPH